jgi:hypothetical protein
MYNAKIDWIDYDEQNPNNPNTIPTAEDLLRIEQGIRDSERGVGVFFETTNNGNNYIISTGINLPTLLQGMTFKLKSNANSTGAITVNFDGLGAKAVKDPSGIPVVVWKNGGVYEIVYNGTDFCQIGNNELVTLLTSVGDIPYASAPNTPARLAIGSPLQYLRVNSEGSGLEYGALPFQITTGSYSGDDQSGRNINIGFTPKFVFLTGASKTWICCTGQAAVCYAAGGSIQNDSVQIVSGGFNVTTSSCNSNASVTTYNYFAIG